MNCICERGLICKTHPELPWPHGNCLGPGMPCTMPACPWWQGQDPPARSLAEWETIHASTQATKDQPPE